MNQNVKKLKDRLDTSSDGNNLRRTEEFFNDDMLIDFGPLKFVGILCMYPGIDSYCDTCELTYVYDEAGSQTGLYNFEMDCPNLPEEEDPAEMLVGLPSYDEEDVCEDLELFCTTCNVDLENFSFDVQGCDTEKFWTNIDDEEMNLNPESEPLITGSQFSKYKSTSTAGVMFLAVTAFSAAQMLFG